MIGFEILINDNLKCNAGINSGIGVLNSIITWHKEKDGPPDVIELYVGGLNSENRNNLNWLNHDLNIGDVVTIKIIESPTFDPPAITKEPEISGEAVLKRKLKQFYSLREELKGHIDK